MDFNSKLLPLYVLFLMAFALGIALTGEKDGFLIHMLVIIPQFWFYSITPNLWLLYKKRGDEGNLKGFLKMMICIPIPYIIIAILIRIFYL
ncbi:MULTISPECIES: hypothetical protein [Pontibacillus]|uniref:Uncharacterized protein n=1 Tax=Pontibacillus chungwhensis TaxID=265426 RepID=A0ABY8UWE3_9BACI|nr:MULTISPECIES: hypothetical protein [Pontibacillus]WIF97743.1 hypothetical protein QNI29_18770 [Pontibacillus chungwhensis]